MTRRLWLACSMGLATAAVGGTARAQDLSPSEKKFVAEAASGGMLEVRLGEYASQNAASDDVRKFGEHMVGDHSKANDQLKMVATRKAIEIPYALNDEDRKVLERLEKLKGAEFDKAYVAQMVDDHVKDVAAFERESTAGSEIEVKGFAEKTLPTLKHHLEMAQDLAKKVGA